MKLHGDRTPTRPCTLASLRQELEEERQGAPAQTDQAWYVGVEGRSVGPLNPAGLEGLVARGQLRRGSLIWHQGWLAWSAAESVPELREILGLPMAAGAAVPPALPQGQP